MPAEKHQAIIDNPLVKASFPTINKWEISKEIPSNSISGPISSQLLSPNSRVTPNQTPKLILARSQVGNQKFYSLKTTTELRGEGDGSRNNNYDRYYTPSQGR